jgi:hypothetical protein
MKALNVLVKTLAASTIGLVLISGATKAQAQGLSLVPKVEAEIKLTNVACLDPSGNTIKCFDTQPLGYTVKSEPYDTDAKGPQFGLSRLFSDQRKTENKYPGFGILFKGENSKDEGTNPGYNEYWLRPVAYTGKKANSLPTGKPFEEGRLEVGRFLFTFQQTVSQISLNLFDIEDSAFSGILEVNGKKYDKGLLPKGLDGNIQTIDLFNVKSFLIQLGKPGPDSVFKGTGDGVDLQVIKVPEPTNTIALGALVVTGAMALRKRKKASPAA